jgi:hypothetical protein
MTSARYLIVMLVVWMLGEAAVGGFNLLIDPLGLSPLHVPIPGVNLIKPMRDRNDALVKRYDVDRLQPKTIFIGSSRVKQSIDPTLLGETQFAPAYNAGFDNGADLGDMESLLEHYLNVDKNLKYVFLEVFITAVISSKQVNTVSHDGIGHYLGDWISLLSSYGAIDYSLRTISANSPNRPVLPDTPIPIPDSGFVPIPLAPHHFSVKNIPNFMTYSDVVPLDRKMSSQIVPAARRIIDLCRSYGVECRFFISPLHADVLYGLYYRGLWGEAEKVKRGLAAIAPVWDFTRYNALIEERSGPVVLWPEAFHYSPALGVLMVKEMTGQHTPDMPPNFGVLLDAGDVEAELAAWRTERDGWILHHQAIHERFREAAANFHKGVSFGDATSAEIAAGGY